MEAISFKDFLESTPPGKEVKVKDVLKGAGVGSQTNAPNINLYCTSKECQGVRFFVVKENYWLSLSEYNDIYISYICRNCLKSNKIYSLRLQKEKESNSWLIKKYGEDPAFGPPIPSQAFKLIGGERELFLMGRRCETQGLGIGAFVYYRRVIENQKVRIFDELIRVISKISPDDAVISELETAKRETQFTKAVETIKHALPQSLNINGYNPLTLLHSALSEGVHAHSDKDCLELASSVRTVLFEFAERLSQALKEEAELNAAINKLANKRPSNK
ncbi:hypothetical protein [Leminorella grimontii]|uniref:hypothetical protein n=1 Tax=Leminorella grimontii TaxID=82981 RepID=UPI00207E55D4|nr:hypothetical protein [Leminorella grimontii]GKX58725.1 hypothetical protein SOASR031_10400 [Leminorella grimontii]